MDKSKRQHLKSLGIVGAAETEQTRSDIASASTDNKTAVESKSDQFSAQVEHIWQSPTVNLVIKNISSRTTTIVDFEPKTLTTDSGSFYFDQLLCKEDCTLHPGEELRIPLNPANDEGRAFSHFDLSLQNAVQSQLQINTHNSRQAQLTTLFNPRLA